MTRSQWRKAIKGAPLNLTLRELAKHLGKPYAIVYLWARTFGYKPKYDRLRSMQQRREIQKVPWDSLSWYSSDIEIAKIHGVSRQIVNRRRKEFDNGR